ncbi:MULTISPECIES: hypothetical protein [unclassified Streptomyces]|uniref:hypothetical protein n=1 Tax=unclassified Streptomyces TaxID=2593676 RepID=UPI0036F10E29
MVPEDEVGPGFAHTIRLPHIHGTPEQVMSGLDGHSMHRMNQRHHESQPQLGCHPTNTPSGSGPPNSDTGRLRVWRCGSRHVRWCFVW